MSTGITLNYWNGRGLMEVPRVMLAIAGKFPGADYVDGRHSSPPENLTANLGRMPCMDCSQGSIGQSSAINFYIATENGLMGSSTFEAAQIISISEHIKELMTAYRALIPYGTEATADQLTTWFDTGAKDSTGPADGSQRSSRFLTWWMGRIEAVVGDAGFAVGSKISLADVLIHNTFAEYLEPESAAEGMAEWKRYPFGSKEKMESALNAHPKLKAICNTVASNENVKKWLSVRGVQYF